MYYELFVKEFTTNKKKPLLDYYANRSINYFTNLCAINEIFKETAKYPLIQLYNYQDDITKSNELEIDDFQTSYFPVSSFVELPRHWATDYSINVISYVSGFSVSGVESAISSINWYSTHLYAMNEPVLSDTLPTKIYRFTYLRTFHNPIVIRLENHNGNVSIHWKVSNGAGGYVPGEIIVNESKKLTTEEWTFIEKKIDSINFWTLPTTETKILGTNGSQWILEGKYLGKYKVVNRWLGGVISEICLEMINLTDLEIEKDKLY